MRQLVATLHHMIHLLPTSLPQCLHLPCHQCPHFRPVNVPYFLELLGHHLLVVEVAGEQSELVTAFPEYVNMTVCVWCVYVRTTLYVRTNDMCKSVCVCVCVMYIMPIQCKLL